MILLYTMILLITMDEKLARKWENYFNKFLNSEQPVEVFTPNQYTRNDQICLIPSLKEIKCQL